MIILDGFRTKIGETGSLNINDNFLLIIKQ